MVALRWRSSRNSPTRGAAGLWRFTGLAGPGELGRRPLDPTTARRILLGLVALALPLLLLGACLAAEGNHGFVGTSLEGPRGPQCLRLVVANDVSGSMSDFATAREQAMAALLDWLPKNLRPDDELAVVDFAQEAVTRLPPTRVDAPSPGVRGTGGAARDGKYTWAAPVLAQLDGWRKSSCDVALVLLSDAQIVLSAQRGAPTPLPADPEGGRRLARAHRVHDVRLLVPDPDIHVPPEWEAGFPAAAPQRFNGLDSDETAKAIASAVAGLTGQKLVHRR